VELYICVFVEVLSCIVDDLYMRVIVELLSCGIV